MKNLTRHIPLGLVLLLLAGVAVYVATHLQVGRINRSVSAAASNSPGALKVSPGPAELPDESKLQTVGENDRLTLKLDTKTAHFLVQDKKDGRVWRSYPNPAQWSRETTVGLWRTHLRSPLMFQYADLTSNKSQPKETNFLEEQGTIQKLETFPGGFRLTFDMPSKKLSVPIEVKLEGDSVVTRIVDSGIKEENLSLLWLRLYPFFGAERSEEQDGYLFIPDGSGALIRFQEGGTNATRIYQEPVFGKDLAYQLKSSDDYSNNARHKISAPVYGAKSGDRGFLAILEEGAEYADLLASPAGAYSTYNWITGQNNYRQKYRQVTNREKERSFDTYNKEARFSGDRVTRYVLLDSQASDYAGMAQRYRTYLMKAYKLNQLPQAAAKFLWIS
ncbi:DUF5696 domain-containing protein [Paenibacillus sp. CC-CFT747]|nr:DUF5696 domain-containing protein [Paenibacillus sp. CC-CFT747]